MFSLLTLGIMLLPALACWWEYVRGEGKQNEQERPSRQALLGALAWTTLMLLLQWSNRIELASDMEDVCGQLEVALEGLHPGEDLDVLDEMPYQCLLILGYDEPPPASD